MRKEKFTFWLIGFGCGMALAGLLGTFAALKINESHYNKQDTTEMVLQREEVMEQLDETAKDEVESREEIIAENLPDNEAQSVQSVSYQEVNIPAGSVASEICSILEKYGVVENGDDFLQYIKSCKMQTRLRTGKLNLPIDAEYETLLGLLGI